MRPTLLVGLCAILCLAQSPNGPDISAYYRLHFGDAPLYRWLRVDPPLTVTVDAAGNPHLGIALTSVFANCTSDSSRNLLCSSSILPNAGGVEADGAGYLTVDHSTTPPTIGVNAGTVWSINGANAPTGFTDLSGGMLRLPEATVADLPGASANTGKVYLILDGAVACDTTVGGGSTRVFAVSTGVAWIALNCQ